MITTERSPGSGTPHGAHGQPSRKRAKIVILTFLLASLFIFTAAPSATAVAFTNSNMSTFWGPPPCRGDKSGICPYYYVNRPDRQTIKQSDQQSTTSESPTSR